MPTRVHKRRRPVVDYTEVERECECGQDHLLDVGCQAPKARATEVSRQEALRMHRDITTKIIISNSRTVSILVGTIPEDFTIHKDLLTLHSSYFYNRLKSATGTNATEQYL